MIQRLRHRSSLRASLHSAMVERIYRTMDQFETGRCWDNMLTVCDALHPRERRQCRALFLFPTASTTGTLHNNALPLGGTFSPRLIPFAAAEPTTGWFFHTILTAHRRVYDPASNLPLGCTTREYLPAMFRRQPVDALRLSIDEFCGVFGMESLHPFLESGRRYQAWNGAFDSELYRKTE